MNEYPYIGSIGIELECAIPRTKYSPFTTWAYEKFGNHFDNGEDGSVEGNNDVDNPEEYITKREFGLWSTKLEDIKEFIDKAYDTYGVVTDDTCGLHINFHPNTRKIPFDLVKADIAHKERQDEFLNAYKERYHGNLKFWNRLFKDRYIPGHGDYSIRALLDENGRPDWTKITENSRNQLNYTGPGKPSQRYAPINLVPANRRGRAAVVEFRVLPGQATSTEAKDSIKWLSTMFNGMLKDMKTNKKLLEEDKIPLKTERENFTPEDTEAMQQEGIRVRTT